MLIKFKILFLQPLDYFEQPAKASGTGWVRKALRTLGAFQPLLFSSETPGVRYGTFFPFFPAKYGINCVFSVRLTNKSFAIIIIFIDEHY